MNDADPVFQGYIVGLTKAFNLIGETNFAWRLSTTAREGRRQSAFAIVVGLYSASVEKSLSFASKFFDEFPEARKFAVVESVAVFFLEDL